MLLRDFVTDEETGIALPPREVPPAGYLDGAERYLFERLPEVADRGTGSEELQALVRDWPSLYHLTPYRATIFDCLGLTRAGDARVLEHDWTARHYSLGRRAAFHKRATLRDGTVTHEPAATARPDGPDAAEIRARLSLSQALATEPYARGDLLVHRVLETVAAEGVGDGFGRHVAALRDWVAERYGIGENGNGDGGPVLVRGEAFDATWWNVVETDAGWAPIDPWAAGERASALPFGRAAWTRRCSRTRGERGTDHDPVVGRSGGVLNDSGRPEAARYRSVPRWGYVGGRGPRRRTAAATSL